MFCGPFFGDCGRTVDLAKRKCEYKGKKSQLFHDVSVLLQELNIVDHDKIYYAPYRKNFYVEVPEIANMTAEGKTVLLTYTKNCVMLSVDVTDLH